MRLRLTSVEKIQVIAGDPSEAIPRRTFMSPYFPNPYVRNSELYTFKFQAASQTDFIAITFDDWLVSPYSDFEFTGANIVNKITGDSERPYIISDGQSMTMTFNTGEYRIFGTYYSFLGFKAVARFYKSRDDIPLYTTDCDRMVTGNEGGIMHLDSAGDGMNRDCIWIIKKTQDYDGVYLRIIRFRSDDAGWAADTPEYSLVVNGGITSMSDERLNIRPSDRGLPSYAVQLSEEGFYIRLKGRYYSDDSLVIAFSMYINDCVDYRKYFKCHNGRCISERLKCDTYDHCGDNSDEDSSMCGFSNGSGSSGSSSYSYSISIGVIIPMVVSVFLVIIMCLLIIFIRRCRRLNNSAFGPGTQVPRAQQGRGRRRRRRNQNVQLSVTVNSGEHPPSYDEVIESTPIGYLNMAFTWSQPEHMLAQPPSYEEAMSPTATTAPQIDTTTTTTTATNSSSSVHGGSTVSLSQRQSAPVLTTALSASLDPRAEVSSSSSSDDASDHDHALELSSSSDSSTDNEHSLICHDLTSGREHPRSGSDPNKGNKETENIHDEIYKRNAMKYGHENEAAQVVLDSPTSVKFKNEERSGVGEVSERGSEQPKPGSSINNREDTDSNRVSENNRDRDRVGGSREMHENSHRPGRERNVGGVENQTGRASGGGNGNLNDVRRRGADTIGRGSDNGPVREKGNGNGSDRIKDDKLSDVGRRQGRERRSETYPNQRSGHAHSHDYRDQAAVGNEDQKSLGNKDLSLDLKGLRSVRPPRVTENSRSQSCADLLEGSDRGRLQDVEGMGQREEDKRFSYAGCGDVSLKRGSLDPFAIGRGLVRDKPTEHLDRCASQSSNNLIDGYNARKNTSNGYDAYKGAAGNIHDSYIHTTDYQGELPKAKRSKTDHLRSQGRFSDSHQSLAPVPETSDPVNAPHVQRASDNTGANYRTANVDKQSNVPHGKTNLPHAGNGAGIAERDVVSRAPRVSNAVFPPTVSRKPDLRVTVGHQHHPTEHGRRNPQSQNFKADIKPSADRGEISYRDRSNAPSGSQDMAIVTRPPNHRDGMYSRQKRHPETVEKKSASPSNPVPDRRHDHRPMHTTHSSEALPRPTARPDASSEQRSKPTPAPRKRAGATDGSQNGAVHGGEFNKRSGAADPQIRPQMLGSQENAFPKSRHDAKAHASSSSPVPSGQTPAPGSGNGWRAGPIGGSQQTRERDNSGFSRPHETSPSTENLPLGQLLLKTTSDDVYV